MNLSCTPHARAPAPQELPELRRGVVRMRIASGSRPSRLTDRDNPTRSCSRGLVLRRWRPTLPAMCASGKDMPCHLFHANSERRECWTEGSRCVSRIQTNRRASYWMQL